jgi:hypothetical protein
MIFSIILFFSLGACAFADDPFGDIGLDDPDVFKPVPGTHAAELSHAQNHTADLLIREFDFWDDVGSLSKRQQKRCPAGYPVSCVGMSCCPAGTQCVRISFLYIEYWLDWNRGII